MALFKKNRNWYIDFYLDGRRLRQKVGPSKQLAQNVLHKIKAQIAENRYLDVRKQKKVKFEKLSEQYLSYAKTNKRSWYRDEISPKSLLPVFGKKHLYEIKPYIIEKYKIDRRKSVSPATVNRELACLKHMLTKAVEWELLEENPAKKVRLLVENNERLRYLTEEEIERLYENSSEQLKPILLTALLTGMRRNEILKLKWEDIDFSQRLIFVRNSKNNEMREIPINDQLMEALKSIKFKSPYVFVREDGRPCISVRTAFENALKRAGIRDFRFHDLRHTFASHLVMSEVDLMAVKELLGHKTIDMTLRYAHLSPQHKRQAVDRLTFLDGHYLDTKLSNQVLTNLVTCCDTSYAGVVKLADAPDSKSGEA